MNHERNKGIHSNLTNVTCNQSKVFHETEKFKLYFKVPSNRNSNKYHPINFLALLIFWSLSVLVDTVHSGQSFGGFDN